MTEYEFRRIARLVFGAAIEVATVSMACSNAVALHADGADVEARESIDRGVAALEHLRDTYRKYGGRFEEEE